MTWLHHISGMKEYGTNPHSKCLQCGKTINYGRTDKKFCCDSCRNNYNNSIRKIHSTFKEKVDRAITGNYTLLNNLVKLGIRQLNLDEALVLGIRPNYVTSYSKVGGKAVFNCYDISFCLAEDRIFNIHRLELSLQDNKESK